MSNKKSPISKKKKLLTLKRVILVVFALFFLWFGHLYIRSNYMGPVAVDSHGDMMKAQEKSKYSSF